MIAQEDWGALSTLTVQLSAVETQRDKFLGEYESNGRCVTQDMVDALVVASGVGPGDPLNESLRALVVPSESTTVVPSESTTVVPSESTTVVPSESTTKHLVKDCLQCLSTTFQEAVAIQKALLLKNEDTFPPSYQCSFPSLPSLVYIQLILTCVCAVSMTVCYACTHVDIYEQEWSKLHTLASMEGDITNALAASPSGWSSACKTGPDAEKRFVGDLFDLVTKMGFPEMDAEFAALTDFVGSGYKTTPTSALIGPLFTTGRTFP